MILNTYSNIFTKLKNNIPELKYIALFDNQYANIEMKYLLAILLYLLSLLNLTLIP